MKPRTAVPWMCLAAVGVGVGWRVVGERPPRAVEALPAEEGVHVIRVDDARWLIKPSFRTYDYIADRGLHAVALMFRTQVVRDPRTGAPRGLRIVGWTPQAPAAALGLRQGDILLSISGQVPTSRARALEILEGLARARVLSVAIERDGKRIVLRCATGDPRNRRRMGPWAGAGLEDYTWR